MDKLKTSQVAKQANINIETIRYYEKLGLISKVPRTVSGYRLFTSETVERIKFIKKAQELGFSLAEVKKILSFSAEDEYSCLGIRDFALDKIKEIDQKILDLKKIKSILSDLSSKCNVHGNVESCPIVQKLRHGAAK